MMYMLQVYVLFALPVFALAGVVILALLAWEQLQRFGRMGRAAARVASSRVVTRPHGVRSLRAA